jgi:hypothetical protein
MDANACLDRQLEESLVARALVCHANLSELH